MLNYQIQGHGPPLLLLHGFGISFNIWNGLVPLLRDHFTLVMVELPGIGRSSLPPPADTSIALSASLYLAAAVDALDSLQASLELPRWSVIGYSSGSRVAEAYLQSHADRVERAIFLCPAVTSPFKAVSLRVGIHLDRKFPQLGNWVLSGWRMRFLIQLLGFNLRPNSIAPAWYTEITSQPMEVLKETLRSMPEEGARPFVVPEEIQALFVWGREDIITATPRRPSSRDVIFHANHSMPQTSARRVGDVILSFLMR
jgi:pimeloyl-ACP methyl ester carboxylesterase